MPMFLPVALPHVIVGLALVASQAPRSTDLFDQLFARTLVTRQSLHSIRARFTETTSSDLLERPLVAEGTIVAAPPARVLMTYTGSEPRTLAIDGKSLVIVWPGRHQREQIDIAQTLKRIDQYFTQASPAELRSMFEIRAETDPHVRDTVRVDMRPKRKQIKQGLERLELWIDQERLLLTEMKMTFPGGDTKRIRLENVEVNVPVTDDTFQIRP